MSENVREITLQRSHPRSLGHVETWTEFWEPTENYCLECGKQSVWVESGEGDYYQGPDFFCLSCLCTFTSPSGRSFEGNTDHWASVLRQRVEALKGGRE